MTQPPHEQRPTQKRPAYMIKNVNIPTYLAKMKVLSGAPILGHMTLGVHQASHTSYYAGTIHYMVLVFHLTWARWHDSVFFFIFLFLWSITEAHNQRSVASHLCHGAHVCARHRRCGLPPCVTTKKQKQKNDATNVVRGSVCVCVCACDRTPPMSHSVLSWRTCNM